MICKGLSVKNLGLYEPLKEYSKAALTLLKAAPKGSEDLPSMIKEKFDISESGGLSKSYVREVVWYFFVWRNEDMLKKIDAYQSAIQAMEEDNTVAGHLNTLVGTGFSMTRIDVDECLRSLLTHLLYKSQGMDFRQVVTESIFPRI